MSNRLAPTLMVAASLALLLNWGAAWADAASSGLDVSRVTVTAANARGDSAVVMSLTNTTSGPISLVSVTSPRSRLSMIDYDTNMCQGNHAMMMLSNILISGGFTQKLGYSYQGAMLRELKAALVKGETIPLVITWTNFQRSRTMTVQAKVVAAPSDIDFGMSALGM